MIQYGYILFARRIMVSSSSHDLVFINDVANKDGNHRGAAVVLCKRLANSYYRYVILTSLRADGLEKNLSRIY